MARRPAAAILGIVAGLLTASAVQARPPIEHLPARTVRALSAGLRARLDAARRAKSRLVPRLVVAPAVGEWVVLRAEAAEIEANFRLSENLEGLLFQALAGAEEALGDLSVDFVVVLTAVPVAAPEAVYLPLANDVRGIGYGHLGLAPDEVFRTGSAPRLSGLVFLNQLQRHLPQGGDPARGRYVFLHELGHRFGVYAQYRDADGQRRDDWLGRDCAHWSFFADTAGSALEGNRWRPLDGADPQGAQVAEGDDAFTYAPMDRYLMGFLPAAAVPPVHLVGAERDPPCSEPARNGEPNPSWAPPLWVGESAQSAPGRRSVTVADVQAAEGLRSPAWPAAQWRFRAVFVLVLGPDTVLSPAEAQAAEDLRRDWTAHWMAAAAPEPAWRAPGGARPLLVTTRSGEVDVPLPHESDAELPDAGLVDGGLVDGGLVDGGLVDGGLVDAGLVDGAEADARARDANAAPDADAGPDALARDGTSGPPDGQVDGEGRTAGGGCAVTPRSRGGWPMMLVLLVGWAARRRRRSRAAPRYA